MKLTTYMPLITRNSFRNRRRSLLTIGSMAVSLCLLSLLMAMYAVLFFGREQTPAQASRLVTRHRVSLTQPMPLSHADKIRQIPGVRAVSVRQWFGGTYRDARDTRNFFARFAVEPSSLFTICPEYIIAQEQKQAFERDRTSCVASRTLANKFGWQPGERITFLGDIFPVTLELMLVGIFDGDDGFEALYFNWEYLREALSAKGASTDTVGQYMVQAERPDDVPRVSKAIDEMFANSPYPTKTESEQAFVLSFVSFLGNLKLFLLVIGGAVTFTILLVSANTLSMSVRERIREVGVLKTLGFTPEIILGTLLGESVTLAFTGGLIGCALAWGLCAVIRGVPTPVQSLRTLNITPLILVLSLLIAILIGLLSAAVPAFSASRRSILDSLRHTG